MLTFKHRNCIPGDRILYSDNINLTQYILQQQFSTIQRFHKRHTPLLKNKKWEKLKKFPAAPKNLYQKLNNSKIKFNADNTFMQLPI